MELIYFILGGLAVMNVYLLFKQRKPKQMPADAPHVAVEKNTPAEQFANMMAYNGTVQGGVIDED